MLAHARHFTESRGLLVGLRSKTSPVLCPVANFRLQSHECPMSLGTKYLHLGQVVPMGHRIDWLARLLAGRVGQTAAILRGHAGARQTVRGNCASNR
jgi:cytosine/adenosine deaminase-related metal-dependent hydrolase